MINKIQHIYFIIFILLSPFLTLSQNKTDDNNRKQGHWIFTNKTRGLPGYKKDQIVEEGYFEDSRKTGTWTFYFNNGKIKHTITYVSNKQSGPAKFYYKNGNLREKGVWKNNRWVGDYKKYYSNGNLKNEFKYNNQGLKNGLQKFYHKNGKLKAFGTWENGNEGLDIHEYRENGEANTDRFKAGPTDPNEVNDSTFKSKKTIVKKKSNKNIITFDGNGYHEFKDREGRSIRAGEFINGYLFEGKTYEYDEKGKITITKVIKKGKVTRIIDNSSTK